MATELERIIELLEQIELNTRPKAKRPTKAKEDVPEATLSSQEAAIAAAIASDPSLAPIVSTPRQLAKDLVAKAESWMNLVDMVKEAGAFMRTNKKRYNNGHKYLMNWIKNARPKNFQTYFGNKNQSPQGAPVAGTRRILNIGTSVASTTFDD